MRGLRGRHAARMRKARLGGWSGWLLLLTATVALILVFLLLLHAGVNSTIGIAGVFAGLGAAGLAQYHARRQRLRSVVFLAKSRSSFARNVCRGLTQGLAPFPDIKVDPIFPPEGLDDMATWQLHQLRSHQAVRADAIVIIPIREDETTWAELAARIRRGVLVVTIDTKPPNQVFYEHSASPPYFIGSDFARGGQDIGEYLAGRLNAEPDATLIVAVGPSDSWPGCERVRWMLYELMRAGVADRVEAVELTSWDERAGAELLVGRIEGVAGIGADPVYVYSGNDKIAVEVDRRLRRHGNAGARIHLVGYDGTTAEDGRMLLEDLDFGLATVNGLPEMQGQAAAEFVVWAYEGELPHFRKQVIPPRVQSFERT